MVRIEGDIVIKRPREEVFDFVADERNEPRYNPRMIRSEKVTDGPVGQGSCFRAEIMTRGGKAEMTIQNTAYDRPRRLASTTYLSNMEIRGALIFDRVPDGTRLQWVWELRPRGLLKVMSPVVARIGKHQEREIWNNLKRLLEGGYGASR